MDEETPSQEPATPAEAPVQRPPDQQPLEASAPQPQPQGQDGPKKHRLPAPERMFPNRLRVKLGRAARPLALILIAIILAAAGYGAWKFTHKNSKPIERFQAAVESFKVVSTDPASNAVDIDPNTTITIDFNEPVNADNLKGQFFVSPMVNGQFTQGKSADEVVFTPDTPFDKGTKVQIMLNGTVQSNRGAKLGANMAFGFTTKVPSDGVLFEKQGLLENIASAESDKKQTFSITVGDQIGGSVDVTLYKSDMDSLLKSLVYQSTADGGSGSADIDTTSLTQLGEQTVKDGDSFDVNQGSGVYVAVATKDSRQVGHVWVVYSSFGLILRQDDQGVTFSAPETFRFDRHTGNRQILQP